MKQFYGHQGCCLALLAGMLLCLASLPGSVRAELRNDEENQMSEERITKREILKIADASLQNALLDLFNKVNEYEAGNEDVTLVLSICRASRRVMCFSKAFYEQYKGAYTAEEIGEQSKLVLGIYDSALKKLNWIKERNPKNGDFLLSLKSVQEKREIIEKGTKYAVGEARKEIQKTEDK